LFDYLWFCCRCFLVHGLIYTLDGRVQCQDKREHCNGTNNCQRQAYDRLTPSILLCFCLGLLGNYSCDIRVVNRWSFRDERDKIEDRVQFVEDLVEPLLLLPVAGKQRRKESLHPSRRESVR
jgi:hypothetical protein